MRIGHKNDAVHTAQDQLAGRVVNDLARDGVELKLRDEPLDDNSVQRQEIEEQGAIRRGGERDQVAPVFGINPLVNVRQVSGLAAKGGTVIDNFELNFATGVVDDRHGKILLDWVVRILS